MQEAADSRIFVAGWKKEYVTESGAANATVSDAAPIMEL
jgi:hypothetical protein